MTDRIRSVILTGYDACLRLQTRRKCRKKKSGAGRGHVCQFKKRNRFTMSQLTDDQVITIVKNVVEQHGCMLVEIDIENHVLNIEGPDDAQARCAIALQDVLG